MLPFVTVILAVLQLGAAKDYTLVEGDDILTIVSVCNMNLWEIPDGPDRRPVNPFEVRVGSTIVIPDDCDYTTKPGQETLGWGEQGENPKGFLEVVVDDQTKTFAQVAELLLGDKNAWKDLKKDLSGTGFPDTTTADTLFTQNTVFLPMAQGDIVTTTDTVKRRFPDANNPMGPEIAAAAIDANLRRWPAKTAINYYIATSGLSQTDITNIRAAIAHIQQYTCIRFKEASSSTRPLLQFQDKVGATGFSCSAGLGGTTGVRSIWISQCGVGNIVHEIGHALGLHHEQNRADRDTKITVDLSKIAVDWRDQYNKANTLDSVTPYDFGSIMHYPGSAGMYAKGDPGRTTANSKAMGQRRALSVHDIVGFNWLLGYTTGCSGGPTGTTPKPTPRPATPTNKPATNRPTIKPSATRCSATVTANRAPGSGWSQLQSSVTTTSYSNCRFNCEKASLCKAWVWDSTTKKCTLSRAVPSSTVSKTSSYYGKCIAQSDYNEMPSEADFSAAEELVGTGSKPPVTMATLSLHNMPSDCWVAIEGSVYALSSYRFKHPAGRSMIDPYCGKVYGQWSTVHTAAHLELAKEFLKGDLESGDVIETDCQDKKDFKDAKGRSCMAWTHIDCDRASLFGYTAAEQKSVVDNCPRACGMCSAPTTGTNVTTACPQCRLYCPYGHVLENGCYACKCKPAPPNAVCKDKSEKCASMKQRCLKQDKFYEYMLTHCCATCGLKTPVVVVKPTDPSAGGPDKMCVEDKLDSKVCAAVKKDGKCEGAEAKRLCCKTCGPQLPAAYDDNCQTNNWPDREKHCGCKTALVNNFQKYGGSCASYCAGRGAFCLGAWTNMDDTCVTVYDITCDGADYKVGSAICQCGGEEDEQALTSPIEPVDGGESTTVNGAAAANPAVLLLAALVLGLKLA